MIFKELINDLKKVKTSQNITEETLVILTQATIDAYMEMFMSDSERNPTPVDALRMTRIAILEEFDFMLMDLQTEMPNQIPNLADSPIGDDILKEQLDKAFKDYNDRLDKK